MGNPTDELRARLDELGVEWWPSDDPCCEDVITHWCVGPFQWTAIDGEKDLWLNAGIAGHEPLTPEQAIAATVGAGTCHFNVVINQDPSRRGRGNICECDKCGYRCARGFIEDERFKHCPNCGAKVVSE